MNIYFKNVKLTAKYLEVSRLDYSLGSLIFSVKQPSCDYVIKIINNEDVADILQADESPFVVKYTDSCYKEILDVNRKMLREMKDYWQSQPELKEPEFIQQIMQAKEREAKDPRQRFIPLGNYLSID